MKLLRLATVYIDPEPDKKNWAVTMGTVTVESRLVNRTDRVVDASQPPNPLLLQASVKLAAPPPIGPDGLVDVPEVERRACEGAIEMLANVMAVTARGRRHIASPLPPVAFVPESGEERAYLDGARAIRYVVKAAMVATSPDIPLDAELLRSLSDRSEGLQSLATFLAPSPPLARYREAVRFFEMAFGRTVSAVEKKLAQFLASGRFGYTRDEVAGWLQHRPGAMHGDRDPAEPIWDADVARYVSRIEQALYDVLLNKEHWGKNDQARRSIWKPAAGTSSESGGIFVVQNRGVKITTEILDGFGSYPHDLSASLNVTPPEWWCHYPKDQTGRAEAGLPAAATDSPPE